MKRFAKISAVLMILSFLLLIYSCQEDIAPPQNYVNIHLTDQVGFNYVTYYGENPNISIGDYPIYFTDKHGNCKIPNVKPPFDISLFSPDGLYNFKHVTRTDPLITFINSYSDGGPRPAYECFAKVNIPSFPDSRLLIVKFLSNEVFFQSKYYIYNVPEIIIPSVYLRIPDNVSEISGKLLIILCYGDYYAGGDIYYIYDFLNYGMKDITLHAGVNPDINFSLNDINTLSNIQNFYYHVNNPVNVYDTKVNGYIAFPGFNKSSDLLFYSDIFVHSGYLDLPKGLPIPCNVKIESGYDLSNLNDLNSFHSPFIFETIKLDSTASSVFLNHSTVNQNTPLYGETGVSENTVFSYSDNMPAGVYVIDIYRSDYYHITSIFTDKNYIRLEDMKNRGFEPGHNTQYIWAVSKFPGFSNMDDFLGSNIYDRPEFRGISASSLRSFYTAP